jgi:hypothetical protein
VIGLSTAIAVVLLGTGVDQSGYLTGAPVPDWVGLATAVGRDAVVLSEGCDVASPGMNIRMLDSDHVQLVDPLAGLLPGACRLARRVHMSDVPCAHNPVGQCDVAFD